MRIDFELTFRDQYLASLAMVRYRPALLAGTTILVAVGFMVFVGIVFVEHQMPSPFQVLIILGCWFWVPLLTAVNVWSARRTIHGPVITELETEGVRISGSTFDVLWKWDAIRRVLETRRYLVLAVSGEIGCYIPKRVMTTSDIARFREITRARIPQRAG